MNRRYVHPQYLEYYSVWTLSLMVNLVLIFDNAVRFFDPGLYAFYRVAVVVRENSAFRIFTLVSISSMHIDIAALEPKLLVAGHKFVDLTLVYIFKICFLISLGMETPC